MDSLLIIQQKVMISVLQFFADMPSWGQAIVFMVLGIGAWAVWKYKKPILIAMLGGIAFFKFTKGDE